MPVEKRSCQYSQLFCTTTCVIRLLLQAAQPEVLAHNQAPRAMPQPFMQHMQHQPFQQNAGTVGGHQAAADAQAHAQAAWASANFGYLWNPPQWGVPSSMALFVPAPLQYAGQLMPQASHPHSQVQISPAVVLALILLLSTLTVFGLVWPHR